MSWTAPRTWVAGEVVTAAIMNTHVRDNELALYPARVQVYNAGTATIATGTITTLSFDQEDFDSDAFHNPASNPSRLTVPAALGGDYFVYGQVAMGSFTGSVEALIKKNGTTILASHTAGSGTADGPGVWVGRVLSLAPTDYVELQVWQNSGGNVTLNGGAGDLAPFFGMFRILGS